MKFLMSGIFLMLIMITFYQLAPMISIKLWKTLESSDKEMIKTDYCVVLGFNFENRFGIMPQLEQRLTQAFKMYEKNLCKYFVVSGAKKQSIFMGDWLESKGIPSRMVIRENASLSTRQNIVFSLKKISQMISKNETELSDKYGFTVITNSFHQYRSRLTFEKALSEACSSYNFFCDSLLQVCPSLEEEIAPHFPRQSITFGLWDYLREILAIFYYHKNGYIEMKDFFQFFQGIFVKLFHN
eukprot:TRINITY_DN12356_c0_g1_i1.p1 TRINITY_DN12356_c0_g1~~TRINITY_DN12356_c0_g1_i1.p1  ORF type:complete len:241 (-),score=42.17 TRINITY_DN12356_c0_g1_i1:8-730(-)